MNENDLGRYRFNQVKNALLETINNKEEPPIMIKSENFICVEDDDISIQFWGWAIVLTKDGKYFLNGTDGG